MEFHVRTPPSIATKIFIFVRVISVRSVKNRIIPNTWTENVKGFQGNTVKLQLKLAQLVRYILNNLTDYNKYQYARRIFLFLRLIALQTPDFRFYPYNTINSEFIF